MAPEIPELLEYIIVKECVNNKTVNDGKMSRIYLFESADGGISAYSFLTCGTSYSRTEYRKDDSGKLTERRQTIRSDFMSVLQTILANTFDHNYVLAMDTPEEKEPDGSFIKNVWVFLPDVSDYAISGTVSEVNVAATENSALQSPSCVNYVSVAEKSAVVARYKNAKFGHSLDFAFINARVDYGLYARSK